MDVALCMMAQTSASVAGVVTDSCGVTDSPPRQETLQKETEREKEKEKREKKRKEEKERKREREREREREKGKERKREIEKEKYLAKEKEKDPVEWLVALRRPSVCFLAVAHAL